MIRSDFSMFDNSSSRNDHDFIELLQLFKTRSKTLKNLLKLNNTLQYSFEILPNVFIRFDGSLQRRVKTNKNSSILV